MILGITSLGEGRQPVGRRIAMWAAHLAGGSLGGALAVGAVWMLLTPIRTLLPRPAIVVGVLAAVAVSLLIDVGAVRRPLRGRQVPATWAARHGAVRGYLWYGLFLGSGLATYVPYALTYATFAAAGLLLGLGDAVLVGVVFGLGRTFVVGPAALKADLASKLLFRSRASQVIVPKLSVALLLVLAVTAVVGS